jgi:hypothetical protein
VLQLKNQKPTTLFMKKSFFFLLSLLSFLLFSCQKEAGDPDFQPENGGNNPAGTDTYLPLTKSTFWKYKDSATGMITTMTVLDKTKTINGKSYTAVLGTNNQTDTFYMTRQGADYFNYAEVSNGASSGTVLFHYLNDTAAVGRNWEYLAGQGNGFPAYFKTTIVERNRTHTVQGKAYSNVIHTRMELSYDMMGERIPAATYDYYIAKNIGIIQVKTIIDMLGASLIASNDLIEYQIK